MSYRELIINWIPVYVRFICANVYVRFYMCFWICAKHMCVSYVHVLLVYWFHVFPSPPGRPPDSPPCPFKAPENLPGSPIDYELSVYYAHLVSMTGLCRYVQQVSGGQKTTYHVTTLFPSMPLRAPQGDKTEHQKKPRESTY